MIKQFLIVFDHEEGKIIQLVEYKESDKEHALRAYSEKEQEYEDRDRVEVVLIGSDSLRTVEQTHGNYFNAPIGKSEYLVGL